MDLLQIYERLSRSQQAAFLQSFARSLNHEQAFYLHSLLQKRTASDPFAQLPLDVVRLVLRHVGVRAATTLAQVCRRWYVLAAQDEMLWRFFFKTRRVSSQARALVRSAQETKDRARVYQQAFEHDHLLERNWRMNLCRTTTVECHGHHVITSVQLDEDGTIITGSDDGLVKVWEGRTGKLAMTLSGHQGGVWALRKVGHTLVSGSTDRTLMIWDATTGRCLHVLAGHTSTVRCVEIVGRWVVSGSRDGTLRVWDAASGECLHVLHGHTASVRCMAVWGPHHVVSGSYDHLCRVWDLRTGACVAELRGHTSRVYSLATTATHIYSGSQDATVRVWDPRTGQCVRVVSGHRALVGMLSLRHGRLVSGSTDGSLNMLDVSTHETTVRLPGAHPTSITALDLNSVVVATGSENFVRFWLLDTGVALNSNVLDDRVDMVWRIGINDNFCVIAYQTRGTSRIDIMDYSPYLKERSARTSK